MRPLAIYGAGGFGRETLLMVKQINAIRPQWEVKGFFDDGLKKGTQVDGLPVIGGLEDLIHFEGSVVLSIANPEVREKINMRVTSDKLSFPSLSHPTSIMGDEERNKIGKGVIITAGVILTTSVHVGDFSIINLSTTVGHDAVIGNYTTIMPGCSISGHVHIGEKCQLGTGSRILQDLQLGAGTVVGAGAVVTKSFPAHSKLIGVPARHVKE